MWNLSRTLPIEQQAQSASLALRLAMIFAVIKLAIHFATNLYTPHLGYGMLHDELYYIMCGRHLAWGYVDHGPIVALQARLAESIFGLWLPGFRIFSAMAGAVRVGLTGLLTWALGGRHAAQMVAMTAVLMAPQYLALDGILSMNSFESMFWMGCVLIVVLMVRGASPRLWLIFGVLAGVGFLNKPSIAFFLLALCMGLLVTPQRRTISSPWVLAAGLEMILLAAPFLHWQSEHNWAMLQFLGHAAHHDRTSPLRFIWMQTRQLNPVSSALWIAGLIWLLAGKAAKEWRWIGWTYLIFLSLMMLLHAKDYYLAPVYPMLFAAGGVAWEVIFARTLAWRRLGRVAFPAMNGVLVLTGVVLLPMSFPVFRPVTLSYYYYSVDMHTLYRGPAQLPQLFGERLGWPELTKEVAGIYESLSPQDRAKVGIVTPFYGPASAINVFGAKYGLPVAISGHNNYWIWGPHGYTGEVMIVLTREPPEQLRKTFASVEIVGEFPNPYAQPYERFDHVYLARGRVRPYSTDWDEFRGYY